MVMSPMECDVSSPGVYWSIVGGGVGAIEVGWA